MPESASQAGPSSLVREALALAALKGLRGGYIEFMRSNTDESIKRSFEEVKKELTNRQSFLRTATSVERYLQAARILYNRLHWRKRLKYENAARDRARAEHRANLATSGVEDDMPLFVSSTGELSSEQEKVIASHACVMPPSEHIFKDLRSKEDISRFEMLESRKILCPLCPVSSEKITNAVHYQGHLLEHHPCAHLYACQFCGIAFLSLEALKSHNGCEGFAAGIVQRITSSGDIELRMKFATLLIACTDCGSQIQISSAYIGESSITHWNEIIQFHMLHNSEKVVPVVIYSEVELSPKVRLRIPTTTPIAKDLEVVCPQCGLSEFDSVATLESHFASHAECRRKSCPECSMQFTQEALFRDHLLSHLGTRACYLAIYLAYACTFISRGVSSCGAISLSSDGGVAFGGVSSVIFTSRLSTSNVDPWECVTLKKKANRRGRKRRAGPAYKKEPDEIETESIVNDENTAKLRNILGSSFDTASLLKMNGFFYSADESKDETAESSSRYNGPENECYYVVGEEETGTDAKLTADIALRFSRYCRLVGGKPLTGKQNPSPNGLFSKVLMCRRCHCLCMGEHTMSEHLSRCCADLQNTQSGSPPFDLEDGLLVFCVYPGNGVPNTRIRCWECSASLCSILGLRIHMAAFHGVLLRVEQNGDPGPDTCKTKPAFIGATTRAINVAVGLTTDGCLPVNLEEKRKEALVARVNPAAASPRVKSSSPVVSGLAPSSEEDQGNRDESPPIVILDSPPGSVQIFDHNGPSSVEILDSGRVVSPACMDTDSGAAKAQGAEVGGCPEESDIEHPAINNGKMCTAEADLMSEIDELFRTSSLECNEVMSAEDDSFAFFGIREFQDDSVDTDMATASTSSSGEAVAEKSKEQVLCEYCNLVTSTLDGLRTHYKYHTEIPNLCFLCDPPHYNLETPEVLLEHIHSTHAYPVDYSKEDGHEFELCTFCNFQMQTNQLVTHLISECYMAPCFLCGDKLVRRADRISHRKSHKEVFERFVCECRRPFVTFTSFQDHTCRSKQVPVVSCQNCEAEFTGPSQMRSSIKKSCIDHFIKRHTQDHKCLICKNEPLEALQEHADNHITEKTETITPSPTLVSCSAPGLLYNTQEARLCGRLSRKRKMKVQFRRRAPSEMAAEVAATSSPLMSALEEASDDDEPSQLSIWEGEDREEVLQSETSRDGNSPPLLEKQRQALADLMDDFAPPPSVMIIENGAAEVREEREDTPSAVPKSAVADDSDDEILIVDPSKERSQAVSGASPPQSPAPIVHNINEGDDECMMLEVVELPTGATSHTVAAPREKKFKCSMCSEMFIRKKTRDHHEQTSHRNDIISDTCEEVYGVPLHTDNVMYLCQQCVVAFEDPQKARRHLAQHMQKAPAYPCERCSGICLSDANLREHLKKHEDLKLSYRCLKCTPNKIFQTEYAMYYHLHTVHSTALIAFCKNCLVASVNMDRVYGHVVYRECSGSRSENPRLGLITLQRSLGFAVASEVYYQPADEEQYKKAVASGVTVQPSLCSHRSFITFGDSFTTCPEDPVRCCGLVNQNRWHSYLCATNKENPGEMPMKPPEGVLVKTTGNENMLDFLTSRFRQKNRNAPEGFRVPPPGPVTLVPIATVSAGQPVPTCSGPQRPAMSTCDVVNRSRTANVEPRTEQQQPTSLAASSAPTQPIAGGATNFMPALRRSLNNQTGTRISQAVCLFCRCTGTPMVCEPTVRAYDAVNMLCTKFREVHPVAAQTLYNSLNSFIRDTSQKHNGRVLFCVCRWHYSPQCFDPTGRQLQNVPPSIVDGQILVKNYQQGLLYPDQSCVCVLSGPPTFSPSTSRQPAPAPPDTAKKPTPGRCIVCSVLPPTGQCKATTFCVDYMIAVPANPPSLKEQWAMSICRSLMIPMAHEILNAFRTTPQPKLCIRHFNPRMMGLNAAGVLVRIMSATSAAYELPVVDFAQVATLSVEFNNAFNKLLEGMEKGQNTDTIIYMLKVVQDLVKCSDERCNQPLNTITDVRLHRFHQLQHHFVCMDCFSTNCVIHTEQEMVEHFATQHFQRSAGENRIQVLYTLNCPLKDCSSVFSSVTALRKHINHTHPEQFPNASDNCATRFASAAKMAFHNEVHEAHSCDVTCCYLCGVADPWSRETSCGLRISHELVHAMKRFVVCKTCMQPMGHDPTGMNLIDHFMRQHMLNQPRRVRHCKICRQNVFESGIAEHVLEQHRLIAFRPRYAAQSNMVSAMNGSELVVYLGIPQENSKPNPLAEPSEL